MSTKLGQLHITIALAVFAALLGGIAVWWLWWRLPKQQVAQLALKIRDPKARADVEDNFRKTVGQALGGAAVLIGAVTAYLQLSQQQRASHDLLISNQVSKGFEQLGNKDAVVVRLGGIYALEGVMNTSDQYHRSVLEALTAFVREGARTNTMPTLPTDIQAALTVIGRRSPSQGDQIDLPGANLTDADRFEPNLTRANLGRANLTKAHLTRANLTRAGLLFANLTDASLLGADLTDAELFDANLTRANLADANLFNASLRSANLTDADLTDARLTDARLTGANLTGANLTGTDLTGASLDGQKQLDGACGSDAVLPKGLTLKPCPPKSPP